jgi:hypothetical protein
MLRLSSDWTLIIKFFIPTVWMVFFGVLVLVILISFRLPLTYQIGMVVCYCFGVLLLAGTLMRLKRVEATDTHLYVTNYFKTYRYTFDSVSRITTFDLILWKLVRLHFREPTSFGRTVSFLRRKHVWEEFSATRLEWEGFGGSTPE